MKLRREIEYNELILDIGYYYSPACKGDWTTPPYHETIEIVSVLWVTMCTETGNTCKVDVYPIMHVDDLAKIEEIISEKHNQK
jgi:hypothetical protein